MLDACIFAYQQFNFTILTDLSEIKSLCDKTINEFETFEDVLNLYEGGIKLPNNPTLCKIRDRIPWEMLKELVRNDGERFLKFPKLDAIIADKSA
ncbi:hypothetical protein OIU84_018819 [Salix udensis]|uniref:Lipoxygenase domain-containing protein n=1 Tax=Salix udensis TaxID=889485 RepID=A0AAD6PIW7_9ROSI|nr:hypothetical protein OIU84_018819 [Salix udensis]